MKLKVLFLMLCFLIFTNFVFGFDSIRLQWDCNFNEGIFTVNRVFFYVFQKDQNGEEILEYWCVLNEQNNWKVNSYYGDILYYQNTGEIEFIFHDGNSGAIYWNVYQPLTSAHFFIEEYRYFLNEAELFSIKCTYNSISEIIKIQGNVFGNKTVLTMDNNFSEVFDDGTSIECVDNNIQINAINFDGHIPWVGIGEFYPIDPHCPCYTLCDCMVFGNPDML